MSIDPSVPISPPASSVQSSTAGRVGPNNSRITQSFCDQKLLENFIRRTKLVKVIEEVTDQYVRTYKTTKAAEDALAAIVLPLHIVFEDFLNGAIDLLHLAVEEPEQFASATKFCTYSIVRSIVKQSISESGLKSVDIDQVHTQLRFTGLPLRSNLIFDLAQRPFRTGLSLLPGILAALTEPEKITIQSVWFCSAGCGRNKIKSEAFEAPTCSNCSHCMSEYTRLRVTQDCYLLRILPAASVETPRTTNKIFRSVTVRLKEHAFNCDLTLGDRYLLTGYYNYHSSAQEFQAWNLIKQ